MVFKYINDETDSTRNNKAKNTAIRQYLCLPQEMVGTYGGYYCDVHFLSSLEHLLQVRTFILRCTNTDHDSNAGRLHHIGQRNYSEPYTEHLKICCIHNSIGKVTICSTLCVSYS